MDILLWWTCAYITMGNITSSRIVGPWTMLVENIQSKILTVHYSIFDVSYAHWKCVRLFVLSPKLAIVDLFFSHSGGS